MPSVVEQDMRSLDLFDTEVSADYLVFIIAFVSKSHFVGKSTTF